MLARTPVVDWKGGGMIDHVGVAVSDYARSRDFYATALAPLGYELAMEFDGRVAGFARDNKPSFWIHQGEPGSDTHVAFAASDSAMVEAFHTAGVEAGGEDNGPPGERPHYHPGYYAAYIRDPDGTNIEAVFHGDEV
jgi:catechol 2,3-dioxygenase-like lactoylglutathione lyase family enzyme